MRIAKKENLRTQQVRPYLIIDEKTLDIISVRERQVILMHLHTARGAGGRADTAFQAEDKFRLTTKITSRDAGNVGCNRPEYTLK